MSQGHTSDDGIYVSNDGICNDYLPCYSTIIDAYQYANGGNEIKVSVGFYVEYLILGEPKDVTLIGGWNNDYSDNSGGQSTIVGSLTISGGTVIVDKIVIEGTTSLTRTEEPRFGCWLPEYWSRLASLR